MTLCSALTNAQGSGGRSSVSDGKERMKSPSRAASLPSRRNGSVAAAPVAAAAMAADANATAACARRPEAAPLAKRRARTHAKEVARGHRRTSLRSTTDSAADTADVAARTRALEEDPRFRE